jgi:hypothetical protein
MSGAIAQAIETAAKKVGKALGEDAAKAVTKLHHPTADNLAKNSAAHIEHDTQAAAKLEAAAKHNTTIHNPHGAGDDAAVGAISRVKAADYSARFSDGQFQAAQGTVEDVISRNGLTSQQMKDLINTPRDELTDEQAALILKVRAELPVARPMDPMQKALNAETGNKLLDNGFGETGNRVRGYVSRLEDSVGIATPAEQKDAFALTYLNDGIPAFPDDSTQSYSLRYQSDAAPVVPHNETWGGDVKDGPPFTGNGFTASKDHIMPEWYLKNPVTMKPGAEVWRLNSDGSSQLAGILREENEVVRWVRVD